MTTYNAAAVSDTVIAYKKGITLQAMRALRDHPLAMFEGATGAPRLFGEAVAQQDDLSVLTIAAADTYAVGYAGATAGTTVASGTELVGYTWTLDKYTGSVRAKVSHQSISGGAVAFIYLYKNGVAVYSSSTAIGSGVVVHTADVSFSAGDVLEWRHKSNGTVSGSTISLPSINADNTYTPISPIIEAANIL